MKYNVGDKVVRASDLTMLFNPFHKKDKRKFLVKTVTEATESLFTIYTDKGRYETVLEYALACGMNEYAAYRQESGNCYSWATRERYLHLEADKEEIRSIIETDGFEAYSKDKQRHESQIKYHQSQLQITEEKYKEDLLINRELLGLAVFPSYNIGDTVYVVYVNNMDRRVGHVEERKISHFESGNHDKGLQVYFDNGDWTFACGNDIHITFEEAENALKEILKAYA